MSSAKDIRVEPLAPADAHKFVRRVHYSHKSVANSQLHLGVFLNGGLHGVMQFGPSMDKRKLWHLVAGTAWNGFIELNRMAFDDVLPRNSESRALGIAFRLMRAHYPHIEWVVSFADGSQCGDGTIYRAAGFALTGITVNSTIYRFPDGEVVSKLGAQYGAVFQRRRFGRTMHGEMAIQECRRMGAVKIPGFQLRYIKFLNPSALTRLIVPVLPYDRIGELGAGMYRGAKVTREKTAGAVAPPPSGR